MPLVRIALGEGKSRDYVRALSDEIHAAMVDTINVPKDDRFQIVHEVPPASLVFDPTYLGIHRDGNLVVIQITLNAGRSVELKRKLYAAIAERLAKNPGVKPENVLINLIEVPKENWSFGKGVGQYAT